MQCSTTPFVDEMYAQLKETLNDYEVIICRWPEYTFALENVSLSITEFYITCHFLLIYYVVILELFTFTNVNHHILVFCSEPFVLIKIVK